MAELDPETNTLRSSATKVLQKRYMWLLGIVGLPTIGDLVREYVRNQAMDYAVSKLGWFGDFIVANPVALTSIGVVASLIVLTVMVVSESSKEIPSTIYEHRDKKFSRPPAPKRWIVGFATAMVIIIAVISFGTYKYWLHTYSRPNSSLNTRAKVPDIAVPIVKGKPDASIGAGHFKEEPPTNSVNSQPRQQVSQQTQQKTQPQPVQSAPANQSAGSTTQIVRIVQIDRNLPKGDRERLADALFEFARVFDKANTAWGKANNLKTDEKGPFLKDLAMRKSKIPGIESAAKEFENDFAQSRQKWKYYGDQIAVIFGDDPDNHALILRNAINEYSQQLDSVLVLKATDDTTLKAIVWPEDIRYDDAIRRFSVWQSECEHRIEVVRGSLQ